MPETFIGSSGRPHNAKRPPQDSGAASEASARCHREQRKRQGISGTGGKTPTLCRYGLAIIKPKALAQ